MEYEYFHAHDWNEKKEGKLQVSRLPRLMYLCTLFSQFLASVLRNIEKDKSTPSY